MANVQQKIVDNNCDSKKHKLNHYSLKFFKNGFLAVLVKYYYAISNMGLKVESK